MRERLARVAAPSGVSSRMLRPIGLPPGCAVRPWRGARPRRCARRPAAARSRRTAAGCGPPQPCSTAASFHDRSMASPTPLFMPSPPVGITRCTASPARKTRPSPIAVGEQQVLLPLADIEHLVLDRHGDGLLEHRRHVGVGLDHRMQGEVPGRILHDQLRRLGVGHVVVPALADRDALEQIVAVIERLPQLQQVGVALQADAELPAHDARAAVAADQVLRLDLRGLAAALDRRGDRVAVLRERQKLAAVAHRDRSAALRRSPSAAARACIARSADRARAARCRRWCAAIRARA